MRIGIDARFSLSGGIDRYIFELIHHLASIDCKNSYYVYVSPKEYIRKFRVKNTNFSFTPLNEAKYHVKAPYTLARMINQDNIDVFHALSYWMIPLFPKCPLAITAHDTLVKDRITHTLRGRIYGMIINTLALSKAAKIIAVSEFTKSQLSHYFPRYKDKMVVIHHGVAQDFCKKSETEVNYVLKKYHLKRDYLLYVGNLKSNKNIPNLLIGYSLLNPELKKQNPLLVVGSSPDKNIHDLLKTSSLNIDEDIFFIDYIADTTTLAAIYNGAKALVMPSIMEYFGLPIIEAMACGIPVVSSNTSCLPEIAGNAAIYFDPLSINEIRLSLEKILLDDDLYDMLKLRAQKNITRFSWRKAARDVLRLYEDLNEEKLAKPPANL